MTRNVLDDLAVPTPPYRAWRPLATLAIVQNEPKKTSDPERLNNMADAFKEAKTKQPREKSPVEFSSDLRERASGARERVRGFVIPEDLTEEQKKLIKDQEERAVNSINAVEQSGQDALARMAIPKTQSQPKPGPTPEEVGRASREVKEVIAQGGKVQELPDKTTVATFPASEGGVRVRVLERAGKPAAEIPGGAKVGDVITEGSIRARVLEVNAQGRPTRVETIEPESRPGQRVFGSVQEEYEAHKTRRDAARASGTPDERLEKMVQDYEAAMKPAGEAVSVKKPSAAKRQLQEDMAEASGRGIGTGHGAGQNYPKKQPEPERPKLVTPREPLPEGNFDISFEKKAEPKLDLNNIKQFIEDSRRMGRSPEFMRGLEQMRRYLFEKAENPRPEPGSERVNTEPTPDIERAHAEAEQSSGGGEGGEGPPPGKARDSVIREIQEIRQMGDTRPVSFWTRVGAYREQSMHDIAVWWNGLGERIAKEKLEKQKEKVRQLEDDAKAYAEGSILGQFLSPIRYRLRILAARRRRDELEAHQNMFADRKSRHEDARNEVLNSIAHQQDIRLKSLERRAHEYQKAATELTVLLETLHSEMTGFEQQLSIERDPEIKSQLQSHIAAFRREYDSTADKIDKLQALLAHVNEKSVLAGQLRNRYSRRAHPPDIPAGAQVPREPVSDKRIKREVKTFTKRAA